MKPVNRSVLTIDNMHRYVLARRDCRGTSIVSRPNVQVAECQLLALAQEPSAVGKSELARLAEWN